MERPAGAAGFIQLNTITLSATGVEPRATGQAQIQYSCAGTMLDQGFQVYSQGLAPSASYDIRVDGTIYATIGTDAEGSGGLPSPAALTPVTNIHLVEVVDSSGQIVLRGTFIDTSGQDMIAIAHIGLSASGGLQARGETLISFKARGKSRTQNVLVETTGLAPGSYKIVINGNIAGKLKVENSGSGQARFMKTEKKSTLPPGIDSVLNITTLQILDSNNQIVLSGRLGTQTE